MRAALATTALALVFAGGAAAAGPASPSSSGSHPGRMPRHAGTVIGEGRPLRPYTSITPALHFFGDTLSAQLAVVADTHWVDPRRLRVRADFTPYVAVSPPQLVSLEAGRFAQLTWTWKLRCLTAKCIPVTLPSVPYRAFRLPAAHVDYLRPSGKVQYSVEASWPIVEVHSQLGPSILLPLLNNAVLKWQFHVAPVASPTFRLTPRLLFWLALGAAALFALAAVAVTARWYRALRPELAPAIPPEASMLERALAYLEWAHVQGDETLQRKALERVASELGLSPTFDGLSDAAHELAWSSRTPEDEDIETLTEQARETGRGG